MTTNKEWAVIECSCCTNSILVNLVDGSSESLGVAEGPLNEEEGSLNEEEGSLTEEVPEETDDGIPDGFSNANSTQTKEHFDVNCLRITGTEVVKDDGSRVAVVKPNMGFQSGIRSETVISTPLSEAKARQPQIEVGTRGKGIQPMGNMKYQKPPKRGQHNNPDLQVSGDLPSDDYNGLSGQEAHLDNLLQAAYESDLSDRGIY